MKKRHLLRGLCAATLAVASLGLAQAQTYPTKPVRLIVPFPAGGATDLFARTLSQKISEKLGQTLVVENRPGAGGTLGADLAAKASPDGYTLLLSTSSTHSIGPNLNPRMPYDAVRDFTPIVHVGNAANIMLVPNTAPAHTLKDWIAYAKANPGRLNYASSGSGTSIHMSGEMFKFLTGVSMLHIPYKGSAPAVNDLLGGQVMMMFDNIPSALPHIKAGKLRALATTGAKRDPTLPDLPTIAEAGVANYESGVWFGLSVPVGTPPEIIAKLSAEAIKGTKSPDYIKRMTDLGYNIMGSSPEQMGEMLRGEVTRWGPIVKASGAKAD